jgi:excisionase family DNA binding protein
MSRSAGDHRTPGAARHAQRDGAPTATHAAFELRVQEEFLDAIAQRVLALLGLEHQQAPQPQWLTVQEAADYLRCGKQRVYNLVHAQRMPFEKEGARLLFDRAALDAWVRKGGAR